MNTTTALTVIGATGKVGALATRDALARGCAVTVLVRDRTRLAADLARHPQLTVVEGELDDPASVRQAVHGAAAVICTVGVRYRKAHPWSGIDGRDDVAPAAVRAVLAAEPAVGQLILLSAYGVGDSWSTLPWIARALISSSAVKTAYTQLDIAEQLVAASGVPHTIVRAVMLTDGPATGRSADATGVALRGNPKVSRADLAHLLVDLAVAHPEGARTVVGAAT